MEAFVALAPVALPPSVGQGRAPAAYGSAGSSASSSGQRQGRGEVIRREALWHGMRGWLAEKGNWSNLAYLFILFHSLLFSSILLKASLQIKMHEPSHKNGGSWNSFSVLVKCTTLKGILGCHLVATLWRHPNISQHAVNPWLHLQMPGLPSSARPLPVWVPCEPCKDEEGKMPCFHGCVFPPGRLIHEGDKTTPCYRFSMFFYGFYYGRRRPLIGIPICWIVFEVDVQSINPLPSWYCLLALCQQK